MIVVKVLLRSIIGFFAGGWGLLLVLYVLEAPDLGVGERLVVRRGEAHHAQEAREAAEMRISEEWRRAAVFGSESEDFDLVAVAARAQEYSKRAPRWSGLRNLTSSSAKWKRAVLIA